MNTETPNQPADKTAKPMTKLQRLAALLGFGVPRAENIPGQRPTVRQAKRMRSAADAKAEKARESAAAAKRAAESGAQVSRCSRCQTWFPTFQARNHHRANTCPKQPARVV